MKTYIFHWKNGTRDEGKGKDPAKAFKSLGYGAGAVAALDYYEEKMKMKLLTKEIEKKLPGVRVIANDPDPVCFVKFFTPDSSWTWYVVAGQKQEDGDWVFTGKVISYLCPDGEYGDFFFSQLQRVRGALGLPVERDRFFEPKPLSQCE